MFASASAIAAFNQQFVWSAIDNGGDYLAMLRLLVKLFNKLLTFPTATILSDVSTVLRNICAPFSIPERFQRTSNALSQRHVGSPVEVLVP
ncbi:hypothetical protein [Marinomonas shanghaiensis]|uniref:hypothetical protein n=1 Tax=Marinomonas shanghaiensis TaxID=2202418 RepID=UPI003A8CBDAE